MHIARGTRIGCYEVTGELGAGGMGEVYRALDVRLQREVALKLLPAHLTSDTERLSRFEREARVLAAISHPNIAAIHGIEECATEAGGRMPVLILELVEGETLQERIARGPLLMDEARVLALQIAEGLEAAHDTGIVHRDLKPANVKITPDGAVKRTRPNSPLAKRGLRCRTAWRRTRCLSARGRAVHERPCRGCGWSRRLSRLPPWRLPPAGG